MLVIVNGMNSLQYFQCKCLRVGFSNFDLNLYNYI